MRVDMGWNPTQGKFSFKHLSSLKMIILGSQGQGSSHIQYKYNYIHLI